MITVGVGLRGEQVFSFGASSIGDHLRELTEVFICDVASYVAVVGFHGVFEELGERE